MVGLAFLSFGLVALAGYVSLTAQIIAPFTMIPVGAFFAYLSFGVLYFFATGRRAPGARWLRAMARSLLKDITPRRQRR